MKAENIPWVVSMEVVGGHEKNRLDFMVVEQE
jgi:hypothetical protein